MTLLKNKAGGGQQHAGRVEAGGRKASEAVWEPGARHEEPGVLQRSPALGFAGSHGPEPSLDSGKVPGKRSELCLKCS